MQRAAQHKHIYVFVRARFVRVSVRGALTEGAAPPPAVLLRRLRRMLWYIYVGALCLSLP